MHGWSISITNVIINDTCYWTWRAVMVGTLTYGCSTVILDSVKEAASEAAAFIVSAEKQPDYSKPVELIRAYAALTKEGK